MNFNDDAGSCSVDVNINSVDGYKTLDNGKYIYKFDVFDKDYASVTFDDESDAYAFFNDLVEFLEG